MLSDEQWLRLEKQRNSLRQEWYIKNDILMRIRQTLAIETDPSTKFKYEQQVLIKEKELYSLTDRLDEIEKTLQSTAILQSPNPPIKIEQELNDSDIERLTDLLIRSGRAEYFARKALCIKIGIEPTKVQFLSLNTENDFALELINYLHSIDNKPALYKICRELEEVFKQGKYAAALENIKSKLDCR